MHLEILLSLIILFDGLAYFFVPRNHLFGFGKKKTISCDYVWTRANRLLGILFALSALLLLSAIFMGISSRLFFGCLCVLMTFAFYIASRTSSIDYEYAKKNNLIDFGEDAPLAAPQKKKKTKKDREAGLTFASSKKFSLMFCLFCAFLIFISYAWIAKSSEFFPPQIFTYYSVDNIASGYVERGGYLRFINAAFWLAQIVCASVLIIISVFFPKAKFLNRPFSLRVSTSEITFAYAASIAIFTALINYQFLAKNLSARANFDYLFTLIFGLMLIFSVWTILFAKSAKNSATGGKSAKSGR